MATSVIVSEADMTRICEHLRRKGTPDVEGAVALQIANPGNEFRAAALAVNISLSNTAARKALAKADLIMVQPKAKDKGGGFTMTILAEPVPKPSKGSGGSRERAVNPPPSSPSQPLGAARGYRDLYDRGRGKRDGVIECWVVDPEQILRGKHGPKRDVTTAIDRMVESGWAQWRDTIPIGKTESEERLYLLVDPETIRTDTDLPDANGAGSAAASSSVAATVTSPSSEASSRSGAALAAKSIPPSLPDGSSQGGSAGSGRRLHAMMGVYMIPLESFLWTFMRSEISRQTGLQDPGGWDPTDTPEFSLAELRREAQAAGHDQEDVEQAIGRMCSAGLLSHIVLGYRVAWNPRDVVPVRETATRRIILAPSKRMAEVETARSIARALAREDGFIDSTAFSVEAAERLDLTDSGVAMTRFLDYGLDRETGSGVSLGLLVRWSTGGSDLLLAPDALSGCDFFLADDRERSAAVKPGGKLHEQFAEELRRRYEEAAKFTSGAGDEVSAAAPALEAQAPLSSLPSSSAPATHEGPELLVGAPIDELVHLRAKRGELFDQQQADAKAEAQLRAEAIALRQRANQLDTQAEVFVESQRARAGELQEIEQKLERAADIQRRIDALAAEMKKLLS